MKNLLISGVVGAVLGAALAIYLRPATIVEKEVQNEVVRKDVVTVIKEVVRPDGTKETSTTTTDKSKENKQNTIVKAELPKRPDWLLSAGYDLNKENSIELAVQRRIIGPVFLGIGADQKGTVKALVTVEF